MKQYIMIFLLAVFGTSVLAADKSDADLIKNLTKEQKIAILQMQQGTTPSSTDTAERWVQIGANIGQMMGGAAKELGIAVNDFSQTTLGEVTMVMIIWYVAGKTILHIVGAFVFLVFTQCSLVYLRRWYARSQSIIIYDTNKTNIFGNHPLVKIETPRIDGGEVFLWSLAHFVTICISIAILVD